MPSKNLSTEEYPNLQPSHAVLDYYHPEAAPYRFMAKNITDAIQWQKLTRPLLAETLGFTQLPRTSLDPIMLESVDCGDYIREKILLHTSTNVLMPVYLLIPKNITFPAPTVIAFHGHGYGVKDIVGLWEDGSERTKPDGYHKDFAVALCRKGFVVAAPEISCFGERQTDFSYLDEKLGQPIPTTCAHTAHLALYLGGTALGLRVFDGQRLIDYLSTRAECDTDKLGAMGISGGGMHTFFSTCLDERIKVCVVSGYYSTFAASILAMDHCPCNFVPDLGKFGEMYDLVGLIAPRPLLVESATRDPIFPVQAVQESVARAKEVFRVFGAEVNIEVDIFEGRHEISGIRAYDFLYEHLSAL